MTYRGHTYEGMHDGKRKGTYTLDGDPEPYTVDCGSLEDLDRIIKRVIDIKEGLYGYPGADAQSVPSAQYVEDVQCDPAYDTLEEKRDYRGRDHDLEEGAAN